MFAEYDLNLHITIRNMLKRMIVLPSIKSSKARSNEHRAVESNVDAAKKEFSKVSLTRIFRVYVKARG